MNPTLRHWLTNACFAGALAIAVVFGAEYSTPLPALIVGVLGTVVLAARPEGRR